MSVSAMKQALEALDAYSWEQVDAARAALRQAIAEAEKQEPAFYVIPATDRFGEGYEQTFWEDPAGFPVYTRPVYASDISQERVDETAKHRHEWIGLTEDEVMNIWYQNGFECMIYAKAIEAKLKEKNT